MLFLLLLAAAEVHEPANPSQLAPLYLQRVQQAAGKHGETHPAVARAAAQAAGFLTTIGRTAEAADMARRALRIDESSGDTAQAAADLELLAAADASGWLQHSERALALRSALPPSATLARLHSRLAEFYDSKGAPKVALDHYRAAVAAYEKLAPPDEAAHAVAMNDLGLALEAESKFGESEKLYRRALAIQQRRLGPRHPETGITLNNLAGAVGATGRLAEAEPLLRRALSILEAKLGPGHARTAACAHNLGDLLAAANRPAAAEPLYRKALAAFDGLGDTAGATEVRASLARIGRK